MLVRDGTGQDVVGRWEALPSGPVATGRHDDVVFLDENTGWVVNGRGQVHRTTDGGLNWQLLHENSGVYFRSVAFANESRGWIGGIFSSGNVLFETYDGGSNWFNVTGRLKSPPGGICGIQALSDQIVYGVGAFYGGPWFVKTTNGGQTWSNSVISNEAHTLIDLYFKNENEGIAVGGTANIDDQLHGDAIVLLTTDGGSSWRTVHRTSHGDGVAGEWGWKISFPTDLVGYVSIEYTGNNSNQEAKFLKTIDGGHTWTEHFIQTSTEISGLQAIGFITEDLGWASGRGTSSVTQDGGITWERLSKYNPSSNPDGELDGSTNRIFVVNSTLAFAVGKYTYKFDGTIPADIASSTVPEKPQSFTMDQNYPNPFTTSTTIAYSLFQNQDVRIKVHDVLGRHVRTLVSQFQAPGAYQVSWDGRDERGDRVSAGAYLYLLDIGDQMEMKQAVVLNN